MFVYFYGKIVDKRAYLPAYLSSSAVSAYLRIIKIKVSKQQNKKKKNSPERTGVSLLSSSKLSE